MPNAKDLDLTKLGKPKFLLVGSTGSGKTSQILTLPGKTFAYLFDPSSLSTLRGFDIEYEMFVPEVVNLAAHSLTKDKGDQKTQIAGAHEVYKKWESDYEEKAKKGFFTNIDNILFDSFTTFADIVMDRILYINNRAGRWPQQDDWTAQMSTIRNVVRTLTGQQGMVLVCTAHDQIRQDEVTTRILNQIMLTGQLRAKLPLLFSDIWHMSCDSKKDVIKYTAQTRPDFMNPTVRCSFQDLDMFHDVTIGDWKNPQNFGIGKLLKNRGYYATQQEKVA